MHICTRAYFTTPNLQKINKGVDVAGAHGPAQAAASEVICTPDECKAMLTGCSTCKISVFLQQVTFVQNSRSMCCINACANQQEHGHQCSHAVCHARKHHIVCPKGRCRNTALNSMSMHYDVSRSLQSRDCSSNLLTSKYTCGCRCSAGQAIIPQRLQPSDHTRHQWKHSCCMTQLTTMACSWYQCCRQND